MPPVTIGVFSNEPSLAMPVWKIMRGISCETFAVLMVLSCEKRWFQSLPPYVVQSPCWAAAGPAAARSTGTTSQRVLMRMDTLPLSWTFGAETDRVWSVRDRRESPLDPISNASPAILCRGRTPRRFERGTELPVSLTLEPRRSGTGQCCGGQPRRGAVAPRGVVRKGAV